MQKYPNIIWILVDSVRSYSMDEDDRGKLPMMEGFGEHSIEFLNVVTSAPSTIMAISAMMTSLPSYLIARNYDDFFFDNQCFSCLNDILKQNGFFNMGFFRHPHPREKFRNLFDFVPHKYWEPHLRHSQVWNNTELWMVLKNFLHDEVPFPAFLFIHFTCRVDPKTSQIVEGAIQDLLKKGITFENSIYILCSDHGYPDPSRGFTPEGIRRSGLSHDLILTDDNIKIPLYIRYPGCKPRKISTTVSSLDITPTILDLAGILLEPNALKQFQGVSLKPLIEGNLTKRPGCEFVRSDARLMYQIGRVTSIQNDDYKFLRHYDFPDEGKDEFYDLNADPLEGENIINLEDPSVIKPLMQFRHEFQRQERDAFQSQVDYVLKQFQEKRQTRSIKKAIKSEPERILMLVEPRAADYSSLAFEVLRKTWPDTYIALLISQNDKVLGDLFAIKYQFSMSETANQFTIIGDSPEEEYDLQFVFTINPSNQMAKKILSLSKSVSARETIVLDCNVNSYRRRRFWYFRLRAVYARMIYIVTEPDTLIKLFRDTYRVLYKKVKGQI